MSTAAADRPEGGGERAVGTALRARLAGFMRTLRDSGFSVGLAETLDAARILASPAAARPSSLRAALRALLCAGHGDWQRFDAVFDAVWLGRGVRHLQRRTGPAGEGRASLQRLIEAGARGRAAGLPDHVERAPSGEAPDAAPHGRRGGASRA